MTAQDRIGLSDSQSNAIYGDRMTKAERKRAKANREALTIAQQTREALTYANRTSAGMAYDFRRRQPKDLREAVRLVRKAYQDEVPTKLHEGDALADDGTPAMTSKAEAYIFGSPTWTDAGKGEHPLVAFYLTPFRATMADMDRAREPHTRRRAAMVQHVAFGMEPTEAAISEGCHPLDAKVVIMDALCSFLRRLSDVRVDARPMEDAA